MASPFRYFRKNAKVMLAFFVVLLMFSWVIGDSLFNYFGGNRNPRRGARLHAGAVAVQWDGGSLTNQQVEQMVMRRRMLSAFLQNVEMEGGRNAYMAGVEPSPLRIQPFRLPDTLQQGVEQSVVQTRLFADAAREAGMRISDETLRQYLYQLGRGNVSPQQMREMINKLQSRFGQFAPDDVMATLREELLAQNFINSNQYSFRTVTPEQRWKDWLRVNERVIVEAAAIPVEPFLVDVKGPTEPELQEFFDKYKDREPSPELVLNTELPSATPGFRIPRKIDVQFLEANYDSYLAKAEEKVTDDEIKKFYDDNKEKMFVKADTGLFEDTPEKKEGAKSDEPATTDTKDEKAPPANETEPPSSATKDDAAKADDAPKSEDRPKSDDPAKTDEQQSSLESRPPTNPFRLAAFLQETKDDAAADNAAKDDAAKSDEAAPPAATSPPAALAPPANATPPADAATPAAGAAPAAPADAAAPKKPPEFQPLDQVKDIVRRRIAEENVFDELNTLANKIQGELQTDFEAYLNLVFAAEAEKKERPAAPKSLTDLAPLAEKYGLKSGSTGPLSFLQFRDTPVGKSAVVDLNRPLDRWLFSGREPDLYEPRTTADIDGNRFIIMKTSDTPGKVPALADVREEVIKAWKSQKAAELAEKHAKELAKKAQESKAPLTTYFADKPDIKVDRTDLFSQLTGGDVGIVNGQYARQPYRLSQPDGIVAPGPAFMKEVFTLKDGQVGAALNNDQTIAYVIRLVEHQPPLDDLRTAYLSEANNWPGLGPMVQGHAQEVAMSLAADLTTNSNLKWERTPDKINDADSEGDTESGG